MKLPPFTIDDLRFTIEKPSSAVARHNVLPTACRQGPALHCRPAVGSTLAPDLQPATFNLQPLRRGMALIITLILLSVTLVMAVAFLALSRRERNAVTSATETTLARQAAETALALAQAQILANVFTTNAAAYNFGLVVSTNYINAQGFTPGWASPLNVNYEFKTNNGGVLSPADMETNIANLWFLPRAPVFIANRQTGVNDFRFYLDLNQSGRFDTNGRLPVRSSDPLNPFYDTNGNTMPAIIPGNTLTNFMTGDPEWIGVLERPDLPHGPNNKFLSRYAFIALPTGNTLDLNAIHNQTLNTSLGSADGYFRNEGVGSWELNLAAFLADLNTNFWNTNTAPYLYQQALRPNPFPNSGKAFEDAAALLAWRYANNYSTLAIPSPNMYSGLVNAGIDGYTIGNLMTNTSLPLPRIPANTHWAGSDNTNHFFALTSDLFNPAKSSGGPAGGFTNRLRDAGNSPATYDRYTFYRMLAQLGTDSTADEGKLNLNYSNAVVQYNVNGMVTNIAIIPGAETNLVRWRPLDFFTAAADLLLRTNTANWFGVNGVNYQYFTNTFAVTSPFSITNIPVWVSNRFVYTPAVNRLLQLAANIYDATTNGNNNLPHIFRPVFIVVQNGTNKDVFIRGYTEITSVNPDPSTFNSVSSPLYPPYRLPEDLGVLAPNVPNQVNIYGVPWIIGTKKGLPAFNQLAVVNTAQITRKLQVSRPTYGAAVNQTNQMYILSVTNNLSISFWNSYDANYTNRSGQNLTIYASDKLSMDFTNKVYLYPSYHLSTNLFYYRTIAASSFWPGSQWFSSSKTKPLDSSFYRANWSVGFIPEDTYWLSTGAVFPYSTNQQFDLSDPLWPLDHQGHLGLLTTNYLQAFILDGNNVIDYVQLRDPMDSTNLDVAVQDPNRSDLNYNPNILYLWQTNVFGSGILPSWGIQNQLDVSSDFAKSIHLKPNTGYNAQYGAYSQQAATYFASFFHTNFQGTNLIAQAQYTPSRTVYVPYLFQANDPLVHQLGKDLSYDVGVVAQWLNNPYNNGIWSQSDDPQNQQLPQAPTSPILGRYQPWLQKGQMDNQAGLIPVTNNYACKDSLVKYSDNWDFPTNQYPTVGWIGRVHRGTPWQTIYLKDADLLRGYVVNGNNTNYVAGTNTWAQWTGDIQPNFGQLNFGQFFDAVNMSPVQDRLLFDVFTTRLNDNAAHGTLSVNQTNLAAWSAVFGGMVVLSNSAASVFFNTPLTITNLIINPAGMMDATRPFSQQPPLWQIVNGPYGINAMRTNTSFFPQQAFTHIGDILSVPALTKQSPFIHLGSTVLGQQQMNYGISDEVYEWLPQQMLGLLRCPTEPRYTIYCFGQTLKPAPDGMVLSGPFFKMITNYQVVAESASRAVVQVHPQVMIRNGRAVTNYTTTLESFNPLPPD